MAANPSVKDNFTFVGGLTTEGGFFIVPENSWIEGENVIPATDGSIARRVGLDYELFHQLQPTHVTDVEMNYYAFTSGIWESVDGNGNIDFLVIQVGPALHFYSAASGTVSATKLPFTVDLGAFKCFGNQEINGRAPVTVVSCYGKLLVTSADTDPFFVVYNNETQTHSLKAITLRIRDFDGIRSPLDVQVERTQSEWTALNFWPHALYNLYNQGWNNNKIDQYSAAHSNALPANSKQWIYGKNSNDEFDTAVLDKQDFGTSAAPKGRFILEAFYQDRASAQNSVGDTTLTPPTVPVGPNFGDSYDTPTYTDQ